MHPRPEDEASPLLRQGSTPSSIQDAPHPRTTPLALRVAAAMYSFAVLGLFTSSIGALLPSISHHYSLSDLHVSTIFLVGPLGYVVASQSNALFHARFGQLGVAVVGPMLHILAAAAISFRPSFPVVLVAFSVAAAGCALLDGSWCAWAGAMERGNTVSGLLHGSFSAGAAMGPFLVAVIVTKGPERWYEWYYVLVSAPPPAYEVLKATEGVDRLIHRAQHLWWSSSFSYWLLDMRPRLDMLRHRNIT